MILYIRKGGIAVDNMQARIEMIIYLITVLKDFINIVLDFLPKRSGSSSLNGDSPDGGE